MGNEGCNASKQLPLPFKCKKAFLAGGASNEPKLSKLEGTEIDEKEADSDYPAVETPEKKILLPRSKPSANFSAVEIPEKYDMISKFFDNLECSVRLLDLRKKLPSFRNISTQVEVLTKRKFLCHHLAQIKYTFSEAIDVEKIYVLDERTSCMVPDMKITILYTAVENFENVSVSKALRHAFRVRLFNFVNNHEEGVDIPEAALPEPFNCQSQAGKPGIEIPWSAEPIVQYFSRDNYFSGSGHISTGEDTDGHCVPLGSKICKSTPSKLETTPKKLMLLTPELHMPKISKFGSPIEIMDSNAEITAPSARKSLTFPQMDANVSSTLACLDELGISVCEAGDPMTVKGNGTEEEVGFISSKKMSGDDASDILEYHKEGCENAIEQNRIDTLGTLEDQKAGSENAIKHQQLLAGLPSLFNSISLIFQSVKSSTITKQELVHKIIFHNFEIEDAEEVEEQLKILERLVPDWICRKTVSSGDLIYCIQKKCDPDAIRARLVEAM